MFRSIFTLFILSALLLSGCASLEKSTFLGAGIGAVVGGSFGAMAGANSSPEMRTQSMAIGLGAGALIGGFIGNSAYKKKVKDAETQKLEGNTEGLQMFGTANDMGKAPTLKPAQVKVRYVEDQIKDGTFVPAHFEYEIAEPARWENQK